MIRRLLNRLIEETIRRRVLIFIAPLCCVAIGCNERLHLDDPILVPHDRQCTVTILFDLSGSFADKMVGPDAKAYDFALQVVDRFFRESIGSNNQLILAQISGAERALLWQGTPMQLRQDFPTVDAFRDFLMAKSDAAGSLVYHSLALAAKYAKSEVHGGKSALFVLSDLADTSLNGASRAEAVSALTEYGRAGGVIGLYWVDQMYCDDWRCDLSVLPPEHVRVESEIVGHPSLPSFD